MWPPRQAPQVAVVHAAPAARKIPMRPSFSAWIATRCDEGVMIRRTPGATLCPSSTAAARRVRPGAEEDLIEPRPGDLRQGGVVVRRHGLGDAELDLLRVELEDPLV